MAKQKPVLKNKPFILIIRDGWGYNPNPDEDEYMPSSVPTPRWTIC